MRSCVADALRARSLSADVSTDRQSLSQCRVAKNDLRAIMRRECRRSGVPSLDRFDRHSVEFLNLVLSTVRGARSALVVVETRARAAHVVGERRCVLGLAHRSSSEQVQRALCGRRRRRRDAACSSRASAARRALSTPLAVRAACVSGGVAPTTARGAVCCASSWSRARSPTSTQRSRCVCRRSARAVVSIAPQQSTTIASSPSASSRRVAEGSPAAVAAFMLVLSDVVKHHVRLKFLGLVAFADAMHLVCRRRCRRRRALTRAGSITPRSRHKARRASGCSP